MIKASNRASLAGASAVVIATLNTRLQRTRAAPVRSPLSRKPLGSSSNMVAEC